MSHDNILQEKGTPWGGVIPFRAPGAKGRFLGAHLPGAERLVETHVFIREKIKTHALNVEEGSGQGAVRQAVQGGDLEALGARTGFHYNGSGWAGRG